MSCEMPFGTRQHVSGVPAPKAPLKHTLNRPTNNTSRSSGAPYTKSGTQPYRTYSLEWTQPYEKLAPILEALALNDGPPYYFLDPTALENPGKFNALPSHWAAPGMYSRDAPTEFLAGTTALISPRVADIATDVVERTGTSMQGAPDVGVKYRFKNNPESPPANPGKYDGGALPYQRASSPGSNGDVYNYSNPSATLLIPPGYVVGLWVSGVFVGAGIQFAEARSATGNFSGVLRTGSAIKIPSTGEKAFYLGNGTDWSMIDVGFKANTSGGEHSIVLYGMAAYYFPVGSVAKTNESSFTRTWSHGRGHMPLWLDGNGIDLSTYQAYSPELTSASLSLTEGFIPW